MATAQVFLINRDGERLTPLWQYGRYAGEYMRDGLIRALSTYGPSPRIHSHAK